MDSPTRTAPKFLSIKHLSQFFKTPGDEPRSTRLAGFQAHSDIALPTSLGGALTVNSVSVREIPVVVLDPLH